MTISVTDWSIFDEKEALIEFSYTVYGDKAYLVTVRKLQESLEELFNKNPEVGQLLEMTKAERVVDPDLFPKQVKYKFNTSVLFSYPIGIKKPVEVYLRWVADLMIQKYEFEYEVQYTIKTKLDGMYITRMSRR